MTLRRALVIALLSVLINLLGARALDALGLIEGLLAPSGARVLLIVPLSVAFYSARLVAYLVAPGWVLAALVNGTLAAQRLRAARGPRLQESMDGEPRSP